MACGRVIVEAGDPVAVEFVNSGVDAEAFDPAFAKGPGVAISGRGRAFGEPSVFAQQRFEGGHAFDVP